MSTHGGPSDIDAGLAAITAAERAQLLTATDYKVRAPDAQPEPATTDEALAREAKRHAREMRTVLPPELSTEARGTALFRDRAELIDALADRLRTLAAEKKAAEDALNLTSVTCANGGQHSTREWAWLDEMVRAGRGMVSFCLTENGDVGIYWPWRHKGERSIGSADTAEDAVLDAMHHLSDVQEAARDHS